MSLLGSSLKKLCISKWSHMRYYIDGKDEDEDKAATLSSMLPEVENIVKSHMPHAYTVQWSTTLYLHLFNFPHYQYLLISNDGNISFVLSHHSQKHLFCFVTSHVKNLEYFLEIFLEYVWLTNIRAIYFYLAVVFKSELLKNNY